MTLLPTGYSHNNNIITKKSNGEGRFIHCPIKYILLLSGHGFISINIFVLRCKKLAK